MTHKTSPEDMPTDMVDIPISKSPPIKEPKIEKTIEEFDLKTSYFTIFQIEKIIEKN